MLKCDDHATGRVVLATLLAGGFLSSVASANGIRIEAPGLEVELQAGFMNGTLGDGVETFSSDDLEFMQNELAADGVSTAGHISLFFANTDDGLAFVSLFDGQGLPGRGGQNDSTLGFNSMLDISANRHWNNDAGGQVDWFDMASARRWSTASLNGNQVPPPRDSPGATSNMESWGPRST